MNEGKVDHVAKLRSPGHRKPPRERGTGDEETTKKLPLPETLSVLRLAS